MAEKEQMTKEEVEYNGLFNFAALYSYAHAWFKENLYGVNEDKYSEKVSGTDKDIMIEWKATRDFSDYFKFEHKIKFEIVKMSDVEAEIDGQKKKMNKGIVKIEIKGALIRDPKSKWDASPFNRFWRDVYNKYVIPSRVKSVQNVLIAEAVNFKEDVKEFLELSGRR